MGWIVFGIWAVIIIYSLKAVAKNAKRTAKPHEPKVHEPKIHEPKHHDAPPKRVSKADSPFGTEVLSAQFEDRENDWLAKQCKEEARILHSGDFLDLGARHSASCDAQAIKALHLLQHDDSIDDGEL